MSFFAMTKTLTRNLFSKPATRPYPFVPKTYFANTRGRVAIAIEQCIFCGICQRKCPTSAIVVNKAEKKWTINRFACTACGNCIENCPKNCLANENHYTAPVTKKFEDAFQASELPRI